MALWKAQAGGLKSRGREIEDFQVFKIELARSADHRGKPRQDRANGIQWWIGAERALGAGVLIMADKLEKWGKAGPGPRRSGADERQSARVAERWGRKKGLFQESGQYPFADIWRATEAAESKALSAAAAEQLGRSISMALAKRRAISSREDALGNSLWRLAQALGGHESSELRVAWVRGAEGADGGERGLGLHAYWMARAIQADNAQELAGLLGAGGVPENVSERSLGILDFAWLSKAPSCAKILAQILCELGDVGPDWAVDLFAARMSGWTQGAQAAFVFSLHFDFIVESRMPCIFEEEDFWRIGSFFSDADSNCPSGERARAEMGRLTPGHACLTTLELNGALSMAKSRWPKRLGATPCEGGEKERLSKGLEAWRAMAEKRLDFEQAAWIEGLGIGLACEADGSEARTRAPRL